MKPHLLVLIHRLCQKGLSYNDAQSTANLILNDLKDSISFRAEMKELIEEEEMEKFVESHPEAFSQD